MEALPDLQSTHLRQEQSNWQLRCAFTYMMPSGSFQRHPLIAALAVYEHENDDVKFISYVLSRI